MGVEGEDIYPPVTAKITPGDVDSQSFRLKFSTDPVEKARRDAEVAKALARQREVTATINSERALSAAETRRKKREAKNKNGVAP